MGFEVVGEEDDVDWVSGWFEFRNQILWEQKKKKKKKKSEQTTYATPTSTQSKIKQIIERSCFDPVNSPRTKRRVLCISYGFSRSQGWSSSTDRTKEDLLSRLMMLMDVTASSMLPWEMSHLGDSVIPNAKDRTIDMIRQRQPMMMYRYRHPMLSALVHVSDVAPCGQQKFTTRGQAGRSAPASCLRQLGKKSEKYIPINPVTAFPNPHKQARPLNRNPHVRGKHSAKTVKSIATRETQNSVHTQREKGTVRNKEHKKKQSHSFPRQKTPPAQ